MEPWILGGLLAGAGYGYVAQRGAFCLNSGFRFIATKRDTTKVKALGVALVVQMLAVPVLFALGWASSGFPPFFPAGAVIGGLLFGMSMHWAVGCAAGVWYKAGAGNLGALGAIAGMAVGATLFEVGPLRGLRDTLRGLAGQEVTVQPAQALGLPLWALTIPVGVIILALLWRTRVTTAGAWTWWRTGALLGLVGVAAWPLAMPVDRPFGLSIIPGSVDLVQALGGTLPASTGFGAWDVLLVVGIALGAALAVRGKKGEKWKAPGRRELARKVTGGLGLGAGASLAGGCTVGHGLTGVALLAPGSLVTLAAIAAGSLLTTVNAPRPGPASQGA